METGSSVGLPTSPPPGVRWGLGDVLVVYVAAQLLAVVVFGVATAVTGWTAEMPRTVPLLFAAQLGLTAGYGLGPVLVARFRGNGPVTDFGATVQPRDVWWAIGGLLLQLVVLPVLYIPIQALTDDDPGEAAKELIGLANNPSDVVLLAIMVVVAAPLVEELFFRGLMLRAFAFRMPGGLAVIISAFLFAAVHGQPLALPGLFVFGLVAGELTRRSGRLGPAWFLHAGFNAVTLAVLVAPKVVES